MKSCSTSIREKESYVTPDPHVVDRKYLGRERDRKFGVGGKKWCHFQTSNVKGKGYVTNQPS